MNDFDFRYLKIVASRKKDLLNGGVALDKIRAVLDWNNGGRPYPRRTYEATVGYFEVKTPDDDVRRAVIEWMKKCPKALVLVKYYAGD